MVAEKVGISGECWGELATDLYGKVQDLCAKTTSGVILFTPQWWCKGSFAQSDLRCHSGGKLNGANTITWLSVNHKLSEGEYMINLVENNKLVVDNIVTLGGLEYKLTDDEVIRLNDIIKGMISSRDGKQSKTTATVGSVAKKSFNGKAKDFEVAMSATKKVVKLDSYVGKDVWEVLKGRFESVGAKYDKETKSITFKTEKDAKEFIANKVVSASERENVWKEWRAK